MFLYIIYSWLFLASMASKIDTSVVRTNNSQKYIYSVHRTYSCFRPNHLCFPFHIGYNIFFDMIVVNP